jgi:hypothetical protein
MVIIPPFQAIAQELKNVAPEDNRSVHQLHQFSQAFMRGLVSEDPFQPVK